MQPEKGLEELTRVFQQRLRMFQFDEGLDQRAGELRARLGDCERQPVERNAGVRLKALSLVCDYLDAQGKSREAAALIQPTGQALMADLVDWATELACASDPVFCRRMIRQRIWCCLAFAVCQYRSNEFEQMQASLDRLIEFTYGTLAKDDVFPCYGTKSQLHYYRGLLEKNRGHLNEAAMEFDLALENARRRGILKRRKFSSADNQQDRLDRELIQMRGSMARILGFGHGALALARGRFAEARAWTTSAQELLSSNSQEIWRNGIDVYGQAASLLALELTPDSVAAVLEIQKRLSTLAIWFASRNARNGTLAEAFSLVAEVRKQQIAHATNGGSLLQLDLTALGSRVEDCLHRVYRHSGALSATAALKLIGCLLRGQRVERCQDEMDRFARVFADHGYAMPEFELLGAELHISLGRDDSALPALLALTEKRGAHRAIRARAWAHLAACELRRGLSPNLKLTMARETVAHVQDGYTKALIRELCESTQLANFGMLPYQRGPEDPRSLDLEWNIELVKAQVIEQAFRRYPHYSVEEIARAIGESKTTLYDFLKDHERLEWVRERHRKRKARGAGST